MRLIDNELRQQYGSVRFPARHQAGMKQPLT